VFENLDYNGKIDGGDAVAADMHFWEKADSSDNLFDPDFRAFVASCEIRQTRITEKVNGVQIVRFVDRYFCERAPYDAPREWILNAKENLDPNLDVIPSASWSTDLQELAQRRFGNQAAGWVWRFAWDLHDGTLFEPGDGQFIGILKDRDGNEIGRELRGSSGDRLFDRVQGGGGDTTPANDRIMDVLTSYLAGDSQTGVAFYLDRGSPLPDIVDLIDGMLCRGWIGDEAELEGLRDVMGYAYLRNPQAVPCPDVSPAG
jgi:hypothetical protein